MNTESIRKAFLGIFVLILCLSVFSGCTTTLVTPYDENLVASTEAFYTKAAGVIEEGMRVSPFNDQERERIAAPDEHDGHFSKFEAKYNDLIIDAEALILRAIASSYEIDVVGQELQEKVDVIIETYFSSECNELSEEIGKTSLTAKNYIDLKCIVCRWKEQHADKDLTRGTQILKRANWEGRKRLIFNAILAIQRAEGFKKNDQT